LGDQPVIYLCSPYAHPDPAVVEQRFVAACRATAALIREGKTTFSPIVHSYPLCQLGLPDDWGFWREHDVKYLEACDEVLVLKLQGWERSQGVQAEVAMARALGKPVSFLMPDGPAEENPGPSRGGEGVE
jgi:nucleoside 2-deoxyribosyltransferase